MKRKSLSEDTRKSEMDAPMNIEGNANLSNPLPNPPETFPLEERLIHEGFMKEALAMVCLISSPFTASPLLSLASIYQYT
jgi:hypothetical protein